jgi:Ca2+-binding EF-hand superfamily protein
MLSDLQKRKLRRLFQLTDFNGDGHIERADYEQSLNIFAGIQGAV